MNSGIGGGHVLLTLTVVMWAWRAVDYALIGSFAPLGVLAFGLVVLSLGAIVTGRGWRVAVRLWGVIMLLAGLARTALSIALAFDPSVSIHAAEAQTLFYHAATLLHLIAGGWLIISPPALANGART